MIDKITEPVESTADKVAEKHGVSRETVRNNAQFAEAVETIGENMGEEAAESILAGESGKTRKEVVEVAKLPPEEQSACIDTIADDPRESSAVKPFGVRSNMDNRTIKTECVFLRGVGCPATAPGRFDRRPPMPVGARTLFSCALCAEGTRPMSSIPRKLICRPSVLRRIQQRLWEESSYGCQYCGDDLRFPNRATLEHIIPRSKGGDDSIENLTVVCVRCQNAKSDDTPRQWLERLETQAAVMRRMIAENGY